MTVKADSKGRLTGATPGEAYRKTLLPDGTIQYRPIKPAKYDQIREVEFSDFTAFFGVPPREVVAKDIQVVEILEKDFLNFGMYVETFIETTPGERVFTSTGMAKKRTLIKIRKS